MSWADIFQNPIFNTALGAVIGAIVSLVISWYFYKLADFPTTVAGKMLDDVLSLLVQDRLGITISTQEYATKEHLPRNKDIPHILWFGFTTKTPKQGESVTILFRAQDTGLNLPDENIIVVDATSGTKFPTKWEGHGYLSCVVEFSRNTSVGNHLIEFHLTDLVKNQHVQSTIFTIQASKNRRSNSQAIKSVD